MYKLSIILSVTVQTECYIMSDTVGSILSDNMSITIQTEDDMSDTVHTEDNMSDTGHTWDNMSVTLHKLRII